MTKKKIIALSIGYQFLTGIAVGIVQSVTLLMGMHSTTMSGIATLLIVPIFGTPFNTGGFTIRLIFEALVEPLESIVGHRSATVLSNFPFYLVLLFIQIAIVTMLVFIRYRKTKTFKDWLIITVFIAVFINGLMNIMWPWWGT